MSLSALEALPNYFSIVNEDRLPLYLKSKSRQVEIPLNEPIEKLWEVHNYILSQKGREAKRVKDVYPSLLDLKLELARRIFFACELCERRCKVDRTVEKGFCKVQDSRVASKFVHLGEEPEIIPSYTIFFSHCTFQCIFCQNWDISQFDAGFYVDPRNLAFDIERKYGTVRNINWVGGEPTPNLPYILEVLAVCDARIAQVWNSNMYMSLETMVLLEGIVDLYLTDFKYGNDKCARRLSNVKNYFSIVSRNHSLANKQCEMVIRHLVMPGHIECCSKPILDWIASSLDTKEFYRAYEYAEALGLNLTA
jgi:putative pyruvate formate lyase activating enzyme